MIRILLLFMLLIPLTGCGPVSTYATKVKLEGSDPLIFALDGSGLLDELIIYGKQQRDVGSDRNFAIWEIQPIQGYMEGRRVDRIQKITYGVVPEGYKQIYPENNDHPPALVSGTRYEYWFITTNAPHARKYFEIQDGKAIEISEQK